MESTMHRTWQRTRRVMVSAALCGVLVGCDSGPKTIPIKGTVTYQGNALTEGTVLYVPVDRTSGRQARGEIQPDGSFELSTFQRGDGAMIGEYQISVVALKPHPGEPTREEIEAMGGIIQRGSAIPERFSDPSTSGLTDSVDRNHSGIKNLELTD